MANLSPSPEPQITAKKSLTGGQKTDRVQVFADPPLDPLGSPSRAVQWFCLANGIPLDVQVVENEAQAHFLVPASSLIDRPNADPLPTLQDKDFVLRDAANIMRYLAAKYEVDEHWYPQDIKKRTRVERYLSWDHLGLRRSITGWIWARAVSGENRKLVKTAEADAMRTIRTLNSTWLKASPFLAGEEPSIADLQAACELAQLQALDFDFSAYPNVSRFLELSRALPGFEEVHRSLFNAKDQMLLYVAQKTKARLPARAAAAVPKSRL